VIDGHVAQDARENGRRIHARRRVVAHVESGHAGKAAQRADGGHGVLAVHDVGRGGEVCERAADLHPTPGEILGERAGLRRVDERGVAPGGEGEREIVHVHLAARALGEGDVW
jgi:hypothetical protein